MDCNNFFVSCERLFRPDLRQRPVAVLSSNDGCIVARSQEVKDLGVPMGIPLFEVKELCEKHNVTLFSSNFTLYRDISRRVMRALRDEYGSISIYSIDEAFFEVAEPVCVDAIMDIRSRIMQKTGIPVSFGIADTKTIAKVANGEAKRGTGVVRIDLNEFKRIAPSISCGSVWGIGRETTLKLSALNINTVADLRSAGLGFMRHQFGVQGERLFFELSGIPASPGDVEDSIHGSISSTRSFAHAVHDKAMLQSALGYHVTHIGEKLRERCVTASVLSIMCTPSRYGAYALRKGNAHIELDCPTNDTGKLLKEAFILLDRLYEVGVPYKKAGITVSGIIPEAFVSGRLFNSPGGEKQEEMYQTIDSINNRFGRNTVRPGVTLNQGDWQENKRLKSPEYTTRWAHLARVKAI